MAKTLDFKDFLTVDYAPGMDPIIKRNAKKRKMDSGAGSNAEYSSTYAPGEEVDGEIVEATPPGGKPLPALNPKQAHNWLDQGKHAKKLSMGWPTKNVIVKQKDAAGKVAHHAHVHQYTEEVDLDEALTSQQRRLRAIQMKRKAPKIELGRERAARRFADKDRLMRRARRQARTRLYKMLTKGIAKGEMSYQRRQEIEKRLDSPGMKKAIDRIAMKLLPKERQAEIQRHRAGGQE